MFDILVYLFENFFRADTYPDPERLALKLSAAGFQAEDISEALLWLDGLQEAGPDIRLRRLPDRRSVRLYSVDELARLDTDCRGFLAFLESAGVLNALTRELILERATALKRSSLTLPKLKIIVLLVLWQQQQAMDALILDELLAGDDARCLH